MTNPDPEPSDTLPGAGSTLRFDQLLPLILLSLPLLRFFFVLVSPGGFVTEAMYATLRPAVLNASTMATAIGNNVHDSNIDR